MKKSIDYMTIGTCELISEIGAEIVIEDGRTYLIDEGEEEDNK